MNSGQLSYRRLWTFFAPLGASDLMVSLIHPLVMINLARTSDGLFAVAVYGAVIATIIFFESPVIMLMHAGNALLTDTASFRLVRAYALTVSALACVPVAALVATPLGPLVLQGAMGLSPEMYEAAQPVLKLFLVWPLVIGWKRFTQGVLVRLQQPAAVSFGATARLVTILLATSSPLLVQAENPLVMAGWVLLTSVAVEATIASFSMWWHLSRIALPETAEAGGECITWRGVHSFYVPLIVMTVAMVATRPIMVAGLARLPDAETQIAAWSLVYTITVLFSDHTRVLQHMVIAFSTARRSLALIQRFSITVGVASSSLMLLAVTTPVGRQLLQVGVDASGDAHDMVRSGVLITCLVPLLRSFQNQSRGVLIKWRHTHQVNVAALINVGALVLASVTIAIFQWPGVVAMALGFVVAYGIEVDMLRRAVKHTRSMKHSVAG